jgi:hypothetical protein
MHDLSQHPVWQMLLIAIPFFVILLFSIFGADLMRGKHKKGNKTLRPPSGIDKKGNPILSDPDGRPSKR